MINNIFFISITSIILWYSLFAYYTIPGKMRKSFSLPLLNSG